MKMGLPRFTWVSEAKNQGTAVQKRKPFKVEPRAMGGPAAGFSYDNVGALLEEIEGARHG